MAGGMTSEHSYVVVYPLQCTHMQGSSISRNLCCASFLVCEWFTATGQARWQA